jgi:hypothetical protein
LQKTQNSRDLLISCKAWRVAVAWAEMLVVITWTGAQSDPVA